MPAPRGPASDGDPMVGVGIVGASGSGKTTLLTALIGIFSRRGLSVSTVKHAHHALAFDRPGKDSFRHAEAGAQEVLLASDGGFALFSSHGGQGIAHLLTRLAPVDLVLVEGFKSYRFPKIEVFRPSLGKPPYWTQMDVLAVASDEALVQCPVPVLDLNAPEGVADFLAGALRLRENPGVEEK